MREGSVRQERRGVEGQVVWVEKKEWWKHVNKGAGAGVCCVLFTLSHSLPALRRVLRVALLTRRLWWVAGRYGTVLYCALGIAASLTVQTFSWGLGGAGFNLPGTTPITDVVITATARYSLH